LEEKLFQSLHFSYFKFSCNWKKNYSNLCIFLILNFRVIGRKIIPIFALEEKLFSPYICLIMSKYFDFIISLLLKCWKILAKFGTKMLDKNYSNLCILQNYFFLLIFNFLVIGIKIIFRLICLIMSKYFQSYFWFHHKFIVEMLRIVAKFGGKIWGQNVI